MSDDDKKKALEDLIQNVIEPMIKSKLTKRSDGLAMNLVAIDNSKLDQFLESISDISERDSIALLTLGLSLVFRGSAVHRMTKIEFCDILVANVNHLIDNPPPGFQSTKDSARRVDDCDCPACKLRRKLQEARKRGGDMQFNENGDIIFTNGQTKQ